MQKSSSPRFLFALSSAALLGSLCCVQGVQAAQWNGGGTPDPNWSNPANWGGTAPVSGNALIFDTATNTSNNNDFTGFAFTGITFNATAGAFVIGGNSISFAGAIANSLTTTPQKLNLNITLTGATTIDVVAGGSLTLGGTLTGTATPITKTGAGTLVLKPPAGAPNTYTGTVNGTTGNGTTINGGILEVGTGSIAANCQILFTGANGGGQTLHVTSDITNSTQMLARTANVPATFDIDAGVTWTQTGTVRTDAGAAVTKKGLGTLVLNANNTQLDNSIALNAGTLALLQAGAPGGTGGGGRITPAAGTLLLQPTSNANTNFGDGSTAIANVQHLTVNGTMALNVDRAAMGAGVTDTFSDMILANSSTLNINGGANVNSGTAGMIFANNPLTGAPATALTLNSNGILNVTNPVAGGVTQLTFGSAAGTFASGNGTAAALGANNLTVQGNGNTSFIGFVTGTGSLTKAGTGTLTLTSANSFSGAVAINGGAVSIAASNNLGNAAATNSLSFGGGTLLANATLDLGAARTMTLNAGGGTLDVPGANVLAVSGVVSGSGSLTKVDTGSLILSAANTNNGTVAVNGGILIMAASNNLGDGSATNALSFSGGTLQSTGVSVDLGATRPVVAGSGGGTLDVPNSNTLTISGSISGSGNLTKTSPGALIFSGASPSYTGTTALNAGQLTVSGSAAASATTVASGALLNGTGTVGTVTVSGQLDGTLTAGPVTVASGGLATGNLTTGALTVSGSATISPGGPGLSGTINTSGLTLNSGAIVNFDVGTTAAGGSDSIAVTGDVALNGATLNINRIGGFGAGTYTLLTYTGNLTSQGLTLGTVPPGYLCALDFTVPNKINLNVSLNAVAHTWTAGGADTNWNTAANWDIGVPGPGDAAVIGNAGTVVTVNVPVDITLLTINRPVDVTINGTGSLGIRGAGISISGANNHTISCPVLLEADQSWSLSTGSLTVSGAITATSNSTLGKGGPGVLILTNSANSFGGAGKTVSVTAGSLSIDSDAELGNAANTLTLKGGTLQTSATFSTARAITLGVNDGAFAIAPSLTLTLTGPISGVGVLTKTANGGPGGDSTLILSGTNSYSGATNINGGVLQIGTGGTSGNLGAGGVTDNGTLIFNRSDTLTVANTIGGFGALQQVGAGTTTLSGTNGFSGMVSITGGTLSISASSNLGNATATNGITISAGTLQNTGAAVDLGAARTVALGTGGATLSVTVTGVLTVSGSISGTASLTKTGTGAAILTAANTNSGPVAVNGGILSISASNGLGDGSSTNTVSLAGGTLQNTGATVDLGVLRTVALGAGGGAFDVSGTNVLTVSGMISGSTTLTKTGTGTLILNGSNTNSGPVAINGGTLSVSSSSNLGDGSATNTISMSGGTLTSSVTSLDLTPNRAIANGANGGTFTIPAGNTLIVSGVISGAGALLKNGGGILSLGGVNTYTGNTVLDGGTLAYTAANPNVRVLTFGATVGSANTSTLDLTGGSVTATALTVQTTGAANSVVLPAGQTLQISGDINIGVDLVATALALSGGGNFVATGTNCNIGNGTSRTSTLTLPDGANVLTYTTFNLGVSGGNNGATSTCNMGAGTNVFNNDTMNLGTGKSSGRLQFTGATGSVTIRATNTTGRAATLLLGKGTSGTGASTGTFSFAGHAADVLAGTLTVGAVNGSTAANGCTGNVTFDTGTFDVSTILMGNSLGATPQISTGNFTLGTTSTSTGTLIVNSAGTTGSQFILADGTSNTDITRGTSGTINTSLTLEGGTLDMQGHAIGSGAAAIGNGTGALTLATGTLKNVGEINGGAALTKSGTGTLILDGTNTFNGPLSVSSGILQVGAGGATGTLGAGPVSLASGTTLTFTRTNNLTVANAISGAGGVQQVGVGDTTLSAVNSYTGETDVLAGTLTVNGSCAASSLVVVSLGATLNGSGTTGPVTVTGTLSGTLTMGTTFLDTTAIVTPGGTGTIGTIHTGTLTLNSGTLNFDLGTPASSDLIAAADVSLIGGTLNVTNANFPSGTYTILTYTGTPLNLNLTLGTLPPGYTGMLDFSVAGQVNLDVVAPVFRTWTALGANMLWSNPANWDGGTSIPSAGDYVQVQLAGTTITVDVLVDVAALNITRDPDLTINSSGAGSLGIRGSGMLISGATNVGISSPVSLNANQTWSLGTGNVTVSGAISGNFALTKTGAGTLIFSAANTYGATTIAAGILQVGTGSAAGTLGSGNVTNNGTLTFNRSDAFTVANTIGGSGGVKQSGNGTLTLSGNNSYLGNTQILSGVVKAGSATALGDVGGTTIILDGAALDLNGQALGAEPLSVFGSGISGGGVIVNSSATAASLSGPIALNSDTVVSSGAAGMTLSGVISGASALTKIGAGPLTLSGNNTFAGALTINTGILKAGNANALGTTAGATTITAGAALDLNGQPLAAETLNAAGSGVANSGAIFNSGSAATLTGNINLSADTTIIVGAGSITVSGIIGGGTAALIKDGTGTLDGRQHLRGTDEHPRGHGAGRQRRAQFDSRRHARRRGQHHRGRHAGP